MLHHMLTDLLRKANAAKASSALSATETEPETGNTSAVESRQQSLAPRPDKQGL